MAAGTEATDAVNLGQLQASQATTLQQANAFTNAAMTQVRGYAAQGVASSLAVPSIPMLSEGQKWVGAAVGSYDGQQAVGVAFGYQVTSNFNIGAGFSEGVNPTQGNTNHIAFKVQAGYAW